MKNDEQKNEIIIYSGVNGKSSIEVRMQGETVWLNQKQLAELFDTTKQNISQHINNILKDGELQTDSVVKKILTTADDGKKYQTDNYNLDMIISLGYRIKLYRDKLGTFKELNSPPSEGWQAKPDGVVL